MPALTPCLPTDCQQQTDATCSSQYNGKCKKTCGSTELQTGECQEGCNCCGCRTTNRCSSLGGQCIASFSDCEGLAIKDECSGESCFCCIPGNEVFLWISFAFRILCLRVVSFGRSLQTYEYWIALFYLFFQFQLY